MVRREVETKMCIEIECGDHPAARALAFLSSQSNWELPIRGTKRRNLRTTTKRWRSENVPNRNCCSEYGDLGQKKGSYFVPPGRDHLVCMRFQVVDGLAGNWVKKSLCFDYGVEGQFEPDTHPPSPRIQFSFPRVTLTHICPKEPH